MGLHHEEAGIVGGLEQWRSRLEGYAERLREEASQGEQAEEISDARASAMRGEATSAENALEFINRLAKDLRIPQDTVTWSEFSAWATGLLDLYLDRRIPEAELSARDRIREVLESLRGAESVDPHTTLEVFRQTVEEALAAPMGHQGVTGQGVFVSGFAAASGMTFDAAWLVGMIEGATPPVVRPDPLLPRPTGGLRAASPAGKSASPGRDTTIFRPSPARGNGCCRTPGPTASSQRQAFPSRWFLEQATELEGTRVNTGDLPRLHSREWVSVNESAMHALSGVGEDALADAYDYNRSRLLQWRNDGRSLRDHPLSLQGMLAGASRLTQQRFQERLTEFDGNLSGVAPSSRFVGRLSETPVSATSLESWATCPYRYFLSHILHLGALETPEEITTISARDRGTMVHDILKRFLEESQSAGETPPPGESWSDASRQPLMRIAGEEFRKTEAKGIVGSPLLWRIATLDVRDDLEAFLEADAGVRAGHGTAQTMPEASFGFGGTSPTVQDPETGMLFRGRIDRLDLSDDGTSALVIDYKTGSPRSYRRLAEDAIDQGKRLQLGIYSLAARSIFPGAEEIRAAYWFTTTGANPRFAPPELLQPGRRRRRRTIPDRRVRHRGGHQERRVSGQPRSTRQHGGPLRAGKLPLLRIRLPLSIPESRSLGTQEVRSSVVRLPFSVQRRSCQRRRGRIAMNAPAEASGPAQFQPRDHKDRDKILDCLDDTLFVEASAGTGKTSSLVGAHRQPGGRPERPPWTASRPSPSPKPPPRSSGTASARTWRRPATTRPAARRSATAAGGASPTWTRRPSAPSTPSPP